TGRRTELAPALPDLLAHLVVQLAWEWPRAHAGRVGLGDAPDLVDALGTHAGPDACRPGQRVRRGDERVGAVVDVQHRTLRPLEDDVHAIVEHVPQQLCGVGDVLLQS